ncbi:MAG: pseudouridine synthase [Chloroherpetonaceae bacterium]|nr:pseudouridine synthase [Chloroherpetonaceae bacterium]
MPQRKKPAQDQSKNKPRTSSQNPRVRSKNSSQNRFGKKSAPPRAFQNPYDEEREANDRESTRRDTRARGAKSKVSASRFSREQDDNPLQRKSPSARPPQRPKFRRKGKTKTSKPTGENEGLVRLNRFLSMAGEASRRKADEMILQGEVTVNGKVVTELGTKINPETDRVEHLGKILKSAQRKIYIVMNKPKDTITSLADEKSRTTVIDLLGIEERVYPVGRLDRNTMGVLLLTNDGDLAAKLMHPSSEIKKEYLAELDSKFTREGIAAFKAGMRLKDTGEKVAPAEAQILGDGYAVRVIIHEGKNRQIHRMFYNLGYDVKKLERVSYAGITAAGLRRGAWRLLTPEELKSIKKRAGLANELKKLV